MFSGLTKVDTKIFNNDNNLLLNGPLHLPYLWKIAKSEL